MTIMSANCGFRPFGPDLAVLVHSAAGAARRSGEADFYCDLRQKKQSEFRQRPKKTTDSLNGWYVNGW
jgi:hypothetical protein